MSRHKNRKKIARILLILYLFLFGVPTAIFALIRTPYIQQIIAREMTEYFSEELNTKIEIGSVEVDFMLDITFHDFYIEDQRENPLLEAEKLQCSLSDFILKDNYFSFKKIILQKANINLIKYKGEKKLNFDFIQKYFAKEKKKKENKNPEFYCEKLELMNCNLKYQDLNKDTSNGKVNFNNLRINNLSLLLEDITYTDSLSNGHLRHLTIKDHSGFQLYHMSAMLELSKTHISAHSLKILSNRSDLNLNLRFEFNNFRNFNTFIDSVHLEAQFINSKLNMGDIAFFAPELKGMTSTVMISGHASGYISDIQANDMLLQSGDQTKLFFNLSMKGLPDFNNTQIDFNLKHAKVHVADLDKITLPGAKLLNISKQSGSIKTAQITAHFQGSILDFSADIIAETNCGFIKANINSRGENPHQLYNGNVMFDRFDIKSIAGADSKLGQITGNLSFNGHGTKKNNYFIKGNGKVNSLYFNQYQYSGIQLDGAVKPGYFEGEFLINDPNLSMDFDGIIDYSGEEPIFDFIANIEESYLNPLHFNRNDSAAYFSGIIDINIKGLQLDSMLGKIKLNNVNYYEGDKTISIAYLNTSIEKTDILNKRITVISDIFKGNIHGIFSFNEIGDVVQNYMGIYFPSFFDHDSIRHNLNKLAFSYEFMFSDMQNVLNVFTPGVKLSSNAIAKGSFDSGKNYFKAEIAANQSSYGEIDIINLSVLGETFAETIYFTIQSDQLSYKGKTSLNQLIINTVTHKDLSDFTIHWDNNKKIQSKQYSGDISGKLKFSKGKPLHVFFEESTLVLNDSLYRITKSSNFVIDTGYIWVKEFTLESNSQALMVEGRISKDPMDIIQISFINVRASTFYDLTEPYGINAEGSINGYLLLSNLYKTPDYRSDISIDNLMINNNKVGDAKIKSSWDHTRQSIYSQVWVEYSGNVGSNVPLEIEGFYNPRDKENALDLVIKLDRFDLKLVEPYLNSFSSHLSGQCDGIIEVVGSLDKPDVQGKINFRRTNIKIDYLNMYYSFAHSLIINNQSISMKNITINDMHGNKCTGDLELKHDHFKNLYLDLALSPKKMQFLNTSAKDNNYFYGQAYASGQVNIYGPLDMIQIDVIAKSEPGTVVYIPITGSNEFSENDFINFISNKNDTQQVLDVKTDDTGIRLDLDMEITPEAEVQIVFDPKVGDIMKGNGKGRLKMNMDENGDILMYGSLEIERGEYLFTLENVINKKFLIDKGGIIKWTGDPYKGQIDLTAKYNLKTSLYELISIVDPSEQYKSKVPVNCLMHLSGDLLSPDIIFDIELPNTDENTKNIINSLISTTEEMNRQVFSLLILNSFLQTSSNTYSNPLSQGLGTTSTELLINQFSNWISQISNDFDIGFGYSQGNEISSSQVEVILSTQLFNDRIVIDGNLGVGGSQVNNGGITQDEQASNIVGDVSVEYKIDKEGKFRIKAFNRSNTIDLVTNDAPYTQGLAFFYRKDFTKLSELWIRKNKKTKE